jgi:hypothetical protein
MINRAVVLAGSLVLVTASTTLAQSGRERLPVAVVDVRGASVGLPTTEGWTPPVAENTLVPGRNYGVDLGAHVYALRGKRVALGIGASYVLAKGKTSPPAPAAGAAPSTVPDVTTRLRSLAPQLSINFGHRFGWSYLSGGIGRAWVNSEVTRAATLTSATMVEISGAQTINYGGGARWFLNEHIAFNLDLRWHKLPALAATTTQPATGKASLIVAGGGISIK